MSWVHWAVAPLMFGVLPQVLFGYSVDTWEWWVFMMGVAIVMLHWDATVRKETIMTLIEDMERIQEEYTLQAIREAECVNGKPAQDEWSDHKQGDRTTRGRPRPEIDCDHDWQESGHGFKYCIWCDERRQ